MKHPRRAISAAFAGLLVLVGLPTNAESDIYPGDLLLPPGSAIALAGEWVLNDTTVIRNLKVTGFVDSVPQPGPFVVQFGTQAVLTGDLLIDGSPLTTFESPLNVQLDIAAEFPPPPGWTYHTAVAGESLVGSTPDVLVLYCNWLGFLSVVPAGSQFMIDGPVFGQLFVSLDGGASQFSKQWNEIGDWWLQAPEPSTLMLLLTGALSGLCRRRR